MEIRERASATEQRRIHRMVQQAVKDGRLVKPASCAWCERAHSRLHGHHPDYNRPFMVVWLCPSCHSKHTQRYEAEWKWFEAVRG